MHSPTFDITRDDAAARNRFENFKLGKGLPSTVAVAGPKHGHQRSHSRNTSISSFSFPVQKSTTVNDISHFSFPPSNGNGNGNNSNTSVLSPTVISPASPSPTSIAHPNFILPSKRNSHHRRRSSVSTRHESAEMMGVALPDLPPSTSDDNINLGEKDSIRRRALWALEGKPDVSFSKVQIPDISTPDIERMMFDFSSKPLSTPSYSSGLIGSKRDSFKLLGPSSSAKDQLHTLVEEEEEEDDSVDVSKEDVSSLPSPVNSIKENIPPLLPVTPTLAITKATPSKPRPSNLNLRPLSLTPENLTITPSLPSPSPTPSPRTGLRSLSLSPSPSVDESSSNAKQSRRTSLVISPTPASRRPVLNLALEQLEKSSSISTCDEDSKPSRRSSISYKRSSHGAVTTNISGLPTPEMTPTFGRRYSSASNGDRDNSTSADDEFFPGPPTQARPLSASEQHFLFKSHNALLARITDLERALTMRRRESGGAYSNGSSSRPLSIASNFSSTASGEPSDEMLRLIADLKSERDEMKRDVDGWRTRVADLETQIGVLAKRVENERRDAWVARSRVGGVGQEARGAREMNALRQEEETRLKTKWDEERKKLVAKEEDGRRRVGDLEKELERVRKELEVERLMKNALVFRCLYRNLGLGMGKTHGLGFMSVDSESSLTDVESSDDGQHAFGFKLNSVQEESESGSDRGDYSYSEETYYDEEEENGLAGYEDEEDMDISLQSSSSFGSEEDLPSTGLPPSPTTPKPEVFTPPRASGHVRRATLSKTWTFPFGAQHQSPNAFRAQAQEDDDEEKESVDRFFGCLDDVDSDTSGSVPNSPSAYSYEKSKGDDNASFFLPGVGFPGCDVAVEESDSEVGDDDMFGEIGGIRITFTPPQEEEVKEEPKQIQVSPVKRTSPPPMLPALDFGDEVDQDEDEDDDIKGVIPFNFGRSLMDERQPSPPVPASPPASAPVAFPTMITPPSSLPRPSSPSMIPRPASPSVSSIPRAITSIKPSYTAVPSATASTSTPPKISPMRAVAAPTSSNSFTTPPTKRGGALPSFIPQPVSSPSPIRTAPAASARAKVAIPISTFIRQPTRKPLLPTNKGQNGASSSSAAPSAGNANANVSSVDAAMNTRSSSSSSTTSSRRSSDDSVARQPPPPRSTTSSITTFTNLIPLSWGPSQPTTSSCSTASHGAASNGHGAISQLPSVQPPPAKKIGGYVSREKQLRKLRARMEVEGVVPMSSSVNAQCRNCNGDFVFI
ncbi:hypothetical protein BDZ97DRAFT_1900273 [Flammula alnicola]|nr:hypothetical protein BDZ97DRAFT_1900273 [Flammula alnicola]